MTPALWAVLIPAVVAALAALGAYLQGRQNKAGIGAAKASIGVVDLKLDGNLTAFTARVAELTAALTAAGVKVPPAPPPPG
jgi:hypothetical protein